MYTNQMKTIERIYRPMPKQNKITNRQWRTITIHYMQIDDTFAMPFVSIVRSVWDSEEYTTNHYPIDNQRLLKLLSVSYCANRLDII